MTIWTIHTMRASVQWEPKRNIARLVRTVNQKAWSWLHYKNFLQLSNDEQSDCDLQPVPPKIRGTTIVVHGIQYNMQGLSECRKRSVQCAWLFTSPLTKISKPKVRIWAAARLQPFSTSTAHYDSQKRTNEEDRKLKMGHGTYSHSSTTTHTQT
jgi:hypothetical protein